MRDVNARTPVEAAQIVGLFLRSRSNQTYRVANRIKESFDRGLFYEVLLYCRLPSMWRYLDACLKADESIWREMSDLGLTIFWRCKRILQARDAIGEQFYIPESRNANDIMQYHFDYLTLLLAGIFDAQAQIADKVYQINIRKLNISFRKDEFQKALKKAGANQLYDLVSHEKFQDVMTLIYELRNTIHGASWPFTEIPLEKLWGPADRCGSLERWGLTQQPFARLEPYKYATALVEESFKLIHAIATITEMERLLPVGQDVSVLVVEPPKEQKVFNEDILKRIAVLG